MSTRAVYQLSLLGAAAVAIAAGVWLSMENHGDPRPSGFVAQLGEMTVCPLEIISADKPGRYKAQLANPLKHNLLVRNASVSCGCVKLQKIPDMIPAEASAELVFEFDGSGKRGPKSQDITVRTDSDDPRKSIYTLRLIGTVQGFEMETEAVDFGYVTQGRQHDKTNELLAYGCRSIKIVSIESSDPDIKITQSPVAEGKFHERTVSGPYGEKFPAHAHPLTITVNETSKIGKIFSMASVKCLCDDHEFNTRFTVSATISGPWLLTPAHVLLSCDQKSGPVSQSVKVTKLDSEDADSLRDLVLRSTVDCVEARVISNADGEDVLSVTVQKCPPASCFGTIAGTREGVEVLHLPVAVIAKQPEL